MVALVRRDRPDACLIDRNAPLDDDAETIGRVLAVSAGTSVLVLGANPAVRRSAGRWMRAHPVTCTSRAGVGALISALERVLRGEVVVDVPQVPALRGAQPSRTRRSGSPRT